jgi:hypothetical protein
MFDENQLRTQTQRLLPLMLALWLIALVPAAATLLRFEWTSGATGLAPTRLTTSLSKGVSQKDGREALLVVAIHPLCSCTRATLKELEDSAPTWKQPYRTTFLIYQAKSAVTSDFDWHRAVYIREAQQALHAEVIEDLNGEQAAKLGALTSGEVLLYSAPDQQNSRRLLFSGGVTAGRGMEGENGGIASLEHAINSSNTQAEAHAPVYGCGLAALAQPASGGPVK